MSDSILLNDGSSFLLLNDGSSHLLLNTHVAVGGGVDIVGTHATQLIGPRAAREDPVEFTFWLTARLLISVNVLYRFRLFSTLVREVYSNIKIKSPLLIEISNSLKLKSPLLVKCIQEKIKITSLLLAQSRSSFIFRCETENKKLKKVLLRKLREFLDEDG